MGIKYHRKDTKMNLENKLFELATLVDYGTEYLKKTSDLSYIEEIQEKYGTKQVLDAFVPTDLVTYVIGNICEEYVFDEYSKVISADDIMDCVTEFWGDDEILDYIKHNYALGDMAEWV